MRQIVRSARRPILAVTLLAALAVALLLALPGSSRASGPVSKTGHDFTYYSDASHTTVVGYRFYCIGYSGGWGQITGYSEIGPYPCH